MSRRAAVKLALGGCMLGLFVPVAAAADAPAPVPLGDVLRRLETTFSGITNVTTRFIEEKELSILKRKVILKGHIAVRQPDGFAWHVDEPLRYSMIVTGKTISQWDEESDKVQQASLAANPVIQIVAQQFRMWFSGQYSGLTNTFEVAVTSAAPLTMEFVPRADAVPQKAVRRVTVVFREDEQYLKTITIEEASGDRTRMTFLDTLINVSPDPDDWKVRPHGK